MANDVPILCTRFKPHQAGLKGHVTGRVYHWHKRGFGLALALVDERDLETILKDRSYQRASEREFRLWSK